MRRGDPGAPPRPEPGNALIEERPCRTKTMSMDLEQLCHLVAGLRAQDAMTPVVECIAVQAPIISAIRRLASLHAQSLLVVEQPPAAPTPFGPRRPPMSTRVVGVLRLSDVFEEIAGLIQATDRETRESVWSSELPCR